MVMGIQFPISKYYADVGEDKTLCTYISRRALSVIPGLLALIASVNSFRGYWYLMDVYLMPGKHEVNLKFISKILVF